MDGRFTDMLFDVDPSAPSAMNDLNGAMQSVLICAINADNVDCVRVLVERGVKLVVESVRRSRCAWPAPPPLPRLASPPLWLDLA